MSENNYINEDSYHTDINHPRSFFDKLALGSNVYFAIRFLTTLFVNRRRALTIEFTNEIWATNSMNVFKLIENCGGKFHVEGLDNISKSDEPIIFIGNHMGMMETMILPGLIASRRDVTFVVKDSLTKHPLFGPIMRATKPITVERKDAIADYKKVMSEGVKNLNNNVSIVLFPQSKRMVEFDPNQFNTLGIKLAKKAKATIVPLVLKTDFWTNGKLLKDFGVLKRKRPIHFKFGEPFKIEGTGKEEHQRISDFITSHLDEWNKV